MNVYIALSIAAVGGVLIGLLVGILSGNKARRELYAKVNRLQAQLESSTSGAEELRSELDRRHAEALEAQEKRFNETLEKVSAQMKSATDDMLRQRQEEFSKTSNDSIGQIVNPLKETIDKMKKAMEDTTLSQTRIGAEMKAGIESMIRQSETTRQSTEELSRAFRHKSKVQGDWGELVLRDILLSHGLQEGVEFDTQPYIRDDSGKIVKTEEGKELRPDVILHLDARREVIVDSKVSLSAYIEYVNAEDEITKAQKLKDHLDSICNHVKELSRKDYASYIKPPKVKMDYVIMFMPHSGAWWTAVNEQPDIWRWAFSKNVFIADEQTLYAALRLIDLTWTQITQAQNHQKVYELASEMLNRVGQFYKEYEKIGKSLANAKESYDNARTKLEDRGQSICTTAHKLEKLGAKQSDKNPLPELTDVDDIPKIE